MNFKGFPAFCLLLLFHLPARSQFYTTGEDPASIRWMQIRTPQYRIIFPGELKDAATFFLQNLNATSAATANPFPRKAKPLPVVMHNVSVISNGYVTWAPKRMEIITTPPQDSYAQPWLSQLSLHEYRHVAQISQLYQGITNALSWFTGEAGPGMATALVPSWLYEGDAVWNETMLSSSGRGRSARFAMPVRTLLIDNDKFFSYNKTLLGSYRDYVPDHYQYGYQMASYGRTRFGETIWPEGISYAARHPFLILPMTLYLKSRFGITKAGLYRETMDSLKSLYNNQKDTLNSIIYSSINPPKRRAFTSYTLPRDAGSGQILALRSGIDCRTAFVLIDTAGIEKPVIYTGLFTQLHCDVNGDRVVWDEIARDPRWEGRDFSELRIANLRTGRTDNLTKRTRYFSPAFSPDGKTLAVAETDLADLHFLTVLDVSTGKVIRRIPVPDNRAVQLPAWTGQHHVVGITVGPDGKRIEQVNTESGQWKELLPATSFDISEPAGDGKYILFRSAYQTVENIYALDTIDGAVYQVTSSRFGAFHPSVSRDSAKIYFADYTANGYNIASVPVDPASWKRIKPGVRPHGIWPGTGESSVPENMVAGSAKNIPEAVPYHKAAHLFNFHSWLPFYTDLVSLDKISTDRFIHPGAMLFSQNLLSTVISSIGYEYSGGYHYLKPRISWRGWYPVFEADALIGGPAHALPLPEGMTIARERIPYSEYTLKAYVPLLYNRGPWITNLLPRVEFQHKATWYNDHGAAKKGIGYVHLRLYASRILRPVNRDLYPRLGAYLSAVYTNSPGDKGLLGSMYSALAGIYLPGPYRHHHLVLQGGYQKQIPGFYYLALNRVNFPRGYAEAVSLEFASFSADYAFPIAYPDLSVSWLIYLKRIRADLFYDLAHGTDVRIAGGYRSTGYYRSTGLELRADLHLFRILLPVSAGVRMGYRPGVNTAFAEFLFGIDASMF